jgi:hypothetical protein
MDESDEFPVQEDSNYAIAILRIDEPLHPPDEIKGRVGLIVAEPGQVRSVAPDKRSMLGDIRQDKRVKASPSRSVGMQSRFRLRLVQLQRQHRRIDNLVHVDPRVLVQIGARA